MTARALITAAAAEASTRLDRANALLRDQHDRLSAIVRNSAAPREVRTLAQHYLGKVKWWRAQPKASRDLALGSMGPNGFGPAIDDVCAQAAFHAAREEQQPKRMVG